MTLRFVTRAHGTREVKNALSRDIIKGLEEAGIGIASGTYDIVGLPTVRVRLEPEPEPFSEPRSKRISRETHL
jgi:small-conductance mechanosensitive channel